MMKEMLLIFFLTALCRSEMNAQPENSVTWLSEDLELIRISPNAYIHVSYASLEGYGRVGANGVVFVSGNEAFLFDTPWNDSLTMLLYSWITNSMNLKLAGFVPNHWHADCMGGLGYLQSQHVDSWANQQTIDIARSGNLPVPGHGFLDSLQLKAGDKIISCYYPGPAHTMDNIVVWIPSEKILFAGCMIKSISSVNLGNVVDGDLSAYPQTLKTLLKRFSDAGIVIPGHGAWGGMDLVTHTLELAE